MRVENAEAIPHRPGAPDSIGCPKCFNPRTHNAAGGYEAETQDVVEAIVAGRGDIEGVSISGGEPFQQPDSLLDLAERFQDAGLSVLVFSGYSISAIKGQPLGSRILNHLDLLIAGPYVSGLHVGRALLGSGNQRVHLLSARYGPGDFQQIPSAEVILHTDGTTTLTGIRPIRLDTRQN